MLRLLRFLLLGLVLLVVCIASALVAMRFAIHGREVRVPRLKGLTSAEAERLTGNEGLVLSVESHFYSADYPEGRIVSQSPLSGTRVRRGWKVRVAESLGSQQNSVPGVLGESQRVAELNITSRGQAVGAVATMHFPGAQPSTVIAQSPPPETRNATSPRIALLIAEPDNAQQYIMPGFIGYSLSSARAALERAGFTMGRVDMVETHSGVSGTIVHQFPAAGQKVAAGSSISFEVKK
jgi:beta-lactam-binding protein with PASTA domain